MATTVLTEAGTVKPHRKGNLVEMNWDPITRIVGSLGIYTKIDFEKKKVVECHTVSRRRPTAFIGFRKFTPLSCMSRGT